MNQNKIKYIIISVSAAIILAVSAYFVISARRADIAEKREKTKANVIKVSQVNGLLRENEEILDEGGLKEAIDNYENISQLIPNTVSTAKQSAFNELFLIKNSSEQTDKKEEYKRLEKKLLNNEQTLVIKLGMQLATAAAKQGEYQRAIQYLDSYKIFTESNPYKISDSDRNHILSNILDRQSYYYLFLGDIEKAKELNNKALNLFPENSWAYYTKSLIILEENPNNKKESLKEAKLAYDIFEETYNKTYDQFSYISKNISKSYFLSRLGNTHYLNDNLDEAEKNLTEALTAMGDIPAPENYVSLARLYLAKGDHSKTREYLIKWEEGGGKSLDGYFVKAKLDLALGDKKDAKVNFAVALNLLDTLSPPDLIILPRAKILLRDNIVKEINKVN